MKIASFVIVLVVLCVVNTQEEEKIIEEVKKKSFGDALWEKFATLFHFWWKNKDLNEFDVDSLLIPEEILPTFYRNSLEGLTVENKQILTLNGIEDFPGLKKLFLRKNEIDSFDGIESLSFLRVLDMSENHVSDDTDFAPLQDLTTLESLDLSYNALSALPPVLCKLDNLQFLNVSENTLTNVGALVECTSVEVVDLSNNELTSLTVFEQMFAIEGREKEVEIILVGNSVEVSEKNADIFFQNSKNFILEDDVKADLFRLYYVTHAEEGSIDEHRSVEANESTLVVDGKDLSSLKSNISWSTCELLSVINCKLNNTEGLKEAVLLKNMDLTANDFTRINAKSLPAVVETLVLDDNEKFIGIDSANVLTQLQTLSVRNTNVSTLNWLPMNNGSKLDLRGTNVDFLNCIQRELLSILTDVYHMDVSLDDDLVLPLLGEVMCETGWQSFKRFVLRVIYKPSVAAVDAWNWFKFKLHLFFFPIFFLFFFNKRGKTIQRLLQNLQEAQEQIKKDRKADIDEATKLILTEVQKLDDELTRVVGETSTRVSDLDALQGTLKLKEEKIDGVLKDMVKMKETVTSLDKYTTEVEKCLKTSVGDIRASVMGIQQDYAQQVRRLTE